MKNQELTAIVGADHVLTDGAAMESYTQHDSAASKLPSVVVRPKNADEVQQVVRWANRTGTTLVPVSSGPPHLHGGAAPAVKDAVIVDLTRMKRVLSVDRRNRIAVVEPGVTYEAAPRGARPLWLACGHSAPAAPVEVGGRESTRAGAGPDTQISVEPHGAASVSGSGLGGR